MTGRARKLVFVALLTLGLALVTEAASFVLLWVSEGAWPGPARWRAARAAALAAVAGQTEAGALLAPPDRRPVAWADQVVHPFLGFVQKPGPLNDPRLRITGQGFFALAGEPPGTPEERFTVAVFGGSVAQSFALLGRIPLSRALAALPAAAGKTVWVESYAMGGMKQPQQLMALNYLLALGHKLDLVIVLDGFNDVVLPVAENLRIGVNPFYPRGWPDRVQQVPDPEVLRRVGQIAYLRERRAARAGLCAPRPISWSPTCHLLWRTLDRRLAGRVAGLAEEVATLPRRRRSFLTSGPPYGKKDRRVIYRDLAEHWGRCSRLMADLCRGRGIPYFHFLQPNQYVEGSKAFTAEERRVAIFEREMYRPHAEQGYPLLIEEGRTLAQQGLPFFDLTMVFAGRSEPLYIDTCCHVNRRGNVLLGRHIGGIIVRELVGRGGVETGS